MCRKMVCHGMEQTGESSFRFAASTLFQEGIVHEDDLWSFKLACMAQSMYVVDETTYYYSMQPDSIMRAPSMRNLECRVLVLGYIYDLSSLPGACRITGRYTYSLKT